jgi:hypothetical protein
MTFIPNNSPFKFSKPEACTPARVTFSPLFQPAGKFDPLKTSGQQPQTPPAPACGAIIFLEAPPQLPTPKQSSLGTCGEENSEQQRKYVYM